MHERLYCFKYDGKVEYLEISKARLIDHPEVKRRIGEIIQNSQNKRMTKDGFEPGWQENINAYAGGRLEYDKMLRERGLVEIGKDTSNVKESTAVSGLKDVITGEMAKELNIDLNEQEIGAIKSGDYFKDVETI